MLTPTITSLPQLTLAGFTFYGDPVHSHAGWTEENEIGRVWKRIMVFYDHPPPEQRHNVDETVWYELHLEHPGSIEKGEWEIFVGYVTDKADALPLELCLKILPPMDWAIFTLKGGEVGDFDPLYKEWLEKSEFKEAFPLLIERYDERFKGTDKMEESELDYLVLIRKKE